MLTYIYSTAATESRHNETGARCTGGITGLPKLRNYTKAHKGVNQVGIVTEYSGSDLGTPFVESSFKLCE